MKKILLLLSVLIGLAAVQASAQSRDYDSFFYNPGADEEMKVAEIHDTFSRKGIQYGLVLNPVFMFEDGDDYSLSSYVVNARLWGKAFLWSDTFLFVRLKDSYMGVISGDGAYSELESDNVFDLDLAFLNMRSSTGSVNFSAGRKFYNIGTGLVLNGRGDGAELTINNSLFSFNILGMYTGLLFRDNNPYGLSERDYSDGAKRVFAGCEASIFFSNQAFYFFGLAQVDLSEQEQGTETRYDSQYYGAGLEGVFLAGVAYYAEFIYETGRSYVVDTPARQTDITAYAVNSGLDWYLPVMLKPVIMLQYAFGSGDEGRTNYAASNRQSGDNEDNSFMYFGTFSGGFAFKPILGNMHVVRGGFSFVPFAGFSSPRLNRMSMMLKYACYIKDVASGSVNRGVGGNEDSSFLGQGIDASLRWQLYHDLSLYVNYGIFLPGAAFASGAGNTNFAMAGVNLSF